MWYYKSRIGVLRIFRKNSSYWLAINDDECGPYSSADAAADDVYTFTTGCSDWDLLAGKCIAPTDLSDWERSR